MKIPPLPLATLTAVIIATMLLLSVVMTYVGVERYASYLESGITDGLSPRALAAHYALDKGIVPEGDSLKLLLDQLNGRKEPTDFKLLLAVLICGVTSGLVCAVIGIFLSRRIAGPLEELTSAAVGLTSGNFTVRVAVSNSSTREVLSLVDTFNALATSLENMEKRLRFNTMAVSHELRTPLTILQGSLQGMLDGVFATDRVIISDLLLQVESLGKIVEDLRTLSLAIGQKLVMDRRWTEVSQVVEAVLMSAKPMLDASHLTVETSLQPAFISADALRIRQALLALLENACRYAADGHWLRCETERLPDETVVIRLLDKGPGFPLGLDRVALNPFWRGDPSRSRATGGTGLGLSVVQAIALAHGGQLEFANRQGGGAMVAIHLSPE